MRISYNKWKKTLLETFLDKILENSKIVGECIIYTGSSDGGYGHFSYRHKLYRVHRLAGCIFYKISFDNNQIEFHHKCKNTLCFRSSHLQPLTKGDHAKITRTSRFCLYGHDKNLYGRHGYACKLCEALKRLQYRHPTKISLQEAENIYFTKLAKKTRG